MLKKNNTIRLGSGSLSTSPSVDQRCVHEVVIHGIQGQEVGRITLSLLYSASSSSETGEPQQDKPLRFKRETTDAKDRLDKEYAFLLSRKLRRSRSKSPAAFDQRLERRLASDAKWYELTQGDRRSKSTSSLQRSLHRFHVDEVRSSRKSIAKQHRYESPKVRQTAMAVGYVKNAWPDPSEYVMEKQAYKLKLATERQTQLLQEISGQLNSRKYRLTPDEKEGMERDMIRTQRLLRSALVSKEMEVKRLQSHLNQIRLHKAMVKDLSPPRRSFSAFPSPAINKRPTSASSKPQSRGSIPAKETRQKDLDEIVKEKRSNVRTLASEHPAVHSKLNSDRWKLPTSMLTHSYTSAVSRSMEQSSKGDLRRKVLVREVDGQRKSRHYLRSSSDEDSEPHRNRSFFTDESSPASTAIKPKLSLVAGRVKMEGEKRADSRAKTTRWQHSHNLARDLSQSDEEVTDQIDSSADVMIPRNGLQQNDYFQVNSRGPSAHRAEHFHEEMKESATATSKQMVERVSHRHKKDETIDQLNKTDKINFNVDKLSTFDKANFTVHGYGEVDKSKPSIRMQDQITAQLGKNKAVHDDLQSGEATAASVSIKATSKNQAVNYEPSSKKASNKVADSHLGMQSTSHHQPKLLKDKDELDRTVDKRSARNHVSLDCTQEFDDFLDRFGERSSRDMDERKGGEAGFAKHLNISSLSQSTSFSDPVNSFLVKHTSSSTFDNVMVQSSSFAATSDTKVLPSAQAKQREHSVIDKETKAGEDERWVQFERDIRDLERRVSEKATRGREPTVSNLVMREIGISADDIEEKIKVLLDDDEDEDEKDANVLHSHRDSGDDSAALKLLDDVSEDEVSAAVQVPTSLTNERLNSSQDALQRLEEKNISDSTNRSQIDWAKGLGTLDSFEKANFTIDLVSDSPALVLTTAGPAKKKLIVDQMQRNRRYTDSPELPLEEGVSMNIHKLSRSPEDKDQDADWGQFEKEIVELERRVNKRTTSTNRSLEHHDFQLFGDSVMKPNSEEKSSIVQVHSLSPSEDLYHIRDQYLCNLSDEDTVEHLNALQRARENFSDLSLSDIDEKAAIKINKDEDTGVGTEPEEENPINNFTVPTLSRKSAVAKQFERNRKYN